ncbi:metallophosphoesterase [Streptomyces sp. NPDC050504]|uniref:metallophosphoesterase n=1 Tax=Streptomyces sp. NPDC050504 TaxID=3365618 RepID=UPI0037884163
MLLAHISDLHIGGTEEASQRVERVVAYLDALPGQPDAVLVTGDVADHGEPAEYEEAAVLLGGLRAPVFPCPGNHDVRDAYRSSFLAPLLGEEAGAETGAWAGAGAPVNRLHRAGGYAFLMCDSSVPGEDAGRLGEGTLGWVARTLDSLGEVPAVVAFHHPPVPVHHPYLDATNLLDAAALAEVLEGRENVVAVLTGHAHTAMASAFAGRPVVGAPGVVSTLRLPWEAGEGLTDRGAGVPWVAFHVLGEGGNVTSHFRAVR